MLHKNSVFHDLLKHIPWTGFERLVERHAADLRVRKLSSKTQLIALLYGQLSGAASLREIVGALESHAARLYHLGAGKVVRSTLSDANTQRPPALFAEPRWRSARTTCCRCCRNSWRAIRPSCPPGAWRTARST